MFRFIHIAEQTADPFMNPNNYEVQQKRAKYRKARLVEKSGGSCEKCGYSENLSVLEFHHENDNKSFSLNSRRLSNTSWDRILDEFEKCTCLCANCHREAHNPEMKIEEVKSNLDETYNPDKDFENECVDCEQVIHQKSKRCRSCYLKTREKINWPSTEWLEQKANKYSYSALSRRLGVSGNAVKKRIKNH